MNMAEQNPKPLEWEPPPLDWELLADMNDGYRPPRRKPEAAPQEIEPAPEFEWTPPPLDRELLADIHDAYRPPKPKE